jgi:O-6-methylguanine DNA methyltransferase
MTLSRATIETPLGPMLALASDAGLCALEFTGPKKRLSRLEARLKNHFPPHEIVDAEPPVIASTRAWLDRYFAGLNPEPGTRNPLPGTLNSLPGTRYSLPDDPPLDMHGASFERRVWRALLKIPPGETRSYGGLAKALGNPGAARAVGMANGANPIAIIVPCHRVIGSTGSLTGYGGGLDRKTWLLDHERQWRRDQLF